MWFTRRGFFIGSGEIGRFIFHRGRFILQLGERQEGGVWRCIQNNWPDCGVYHEVTILFIIMKGCIYGIFLTFVGLDGLCLILVALCGSLLVGRKSGLGIYRLLIIRKYKDRYVCFSRLVFCLSPELRRTQIIGGLFPTLAVFI